MLYSDKAGEDHTVTIVGVDEASRAGRQDQLDLARGALIKAREGDTVVLRTPGGIEELDILEVRYPG